MNRKLSLSLAVVSALCLFVACGGIEKDPDPYWPTTENKDPVDPDPGNQPEEPKPDPQPDPDYENIIGDLYIVTPGKVEPHPWEDKWVEGASISLFCEDKVTDLGKTSIKNRGNSSRWYPKPSYNLKFESKEKVMGMPASKRWCLLACWMDRTMLRNDVAFEISRRTGLAWTPRGRFVRLYLNGRYDGLYYLVEKIKIAKNRVNISDDGYIIELDSYYDEVNKFRSEIKNLPVNFKEPDEDLMTEEKFKAFQDYFNECERLICGSENPDPAYRDMIDVDSFIDWVFVQELVQNGESWHPKSTYLYKDVEGKLYAGPTWDHDWATFNPRYEGCCAMWNIWYGDLMKDSAFRKRIKERWKNQREGFSSMGEYIQQRADLIREDALENCKQWPISQEVNGDENLSLDEAVERMISCYNARYAWFDNFITNLW